MLTSGQKPGALVGQDAAPRARRARRPSSAAARARRPTSPSRATTTQMTDFTSRTPSDRRGAATSPCRSALDGVVADAERLREHQAAEADRPGRRAPATTSSGSAGSGRRPPPRRPPRVSSADSAPAQRRPTMTQPSRPAAPTNAGWCSVTGKSGPAPRGSGRRSIAAVALASATGMTLRGFHSKRSSSTASSTAATGDANVADMPAAAPATSSVLRSALVR